MKITVYNLTGQESSSWDFSEKVLGSYSPALLAQALRVYVSNSHQHTSAVKTRGEVDGSTKKIYRQKGTGNARHGAKYAPIFVGGGIAHGPKAIKAENLRLPKTMRRRALASAMLAKLSEKSVAGLVGISKASGKTSNAATLLSSIANHPTSKVLVVTANSAPTLYRMVRSLQGVTMKRAAQVSPLDLISHDYLVITKKAFDAIVERVQKSNKD